MTTQLEKVIANAYSIDFESFCPNAGQQLLGRIPRFYVFGIGCPLIRFREWQTAVINFAIRGEWKGIEEDICGGHHVVREFFAKITSQLSRCRARITLRCDIGYHPLVPGRLVSSIYHCSLNSRVPHDDGFDFSKFNSVATNFHLMIDSA